MNYLAIFEDDEFPIQINMSWCGIRDMVLFEIIGDIRIPNDILCRIDVFDDNDGTSYYVKFVNYDKVNDLTYVLAEVD